MEATLDQPTTTAPRTKLVHVAFYRRGCPAPTRSACGAAISERVADSAPVDCVVCAAILRGIESGVGE